MAAHRGEDTIKMGGRETAGNWTAGARHGAQTLRLDNTIVKRNVRVKLSICLTNKALRHEDVWGNGCIDPHFLNLGTSWR
jgi:hypothetical protein